MLPRLKLRGWLIGTAILILTGLPACGPFGLPGLVPPGDLRAASSVSLRLDNQSGLPVQADLAFELSTYPTRETQRLLTASGANSVSTVVWTLADRITVTARVAADSTANAAAVRVGDVLITRQYELNVDYQPGREFGVVIPPPPSDCNGNGIDDPLDLAAGDSVDDNLNGVPDECELAACCLPDGSCSTAGRLECVSLGGRPQGPDTSCLTTACAQPSAACCLPGGLCDAIEEADCWSQGGIPQGPTSSCPATACPSRRLHVRWSATGLNDGSSWSDAYTDLQSALDEAGIPANLVSEIWVSAGSYIPTHRLAAGDPRSATFALPNAIHIYGGFNGTESSLQERDLLNPSNETVLSGDIGSPGMDTDNLYHVVTAFMSLSIGSLDGFTVRNGYANTLSTIGGVPAWFGGGMYVAGGIPRIVNCRFIRNSALFGGGLCLDGTYHSSGARAWVVNCKFYENRALTAAARGGGVLITSETTGSPVNVALVNCLFDGNISLGRGGGLLADAAAYQPTGVLNCTFAQNSANDVVGGGAAMYMSTRIANSIFWNNGGISENIQLDGSAGAVSVSRSCIEGWTGGLDPSGIGNISNDPLFIDLDGTDGIAGNPDDDLRPIFGSPCIDGGANLFLLPDFVDLDYNGVRYEMIPLDLNRRTRVRIPPTAVIDMGAYEFQGV